MGVNKDYDACSGRIVSTIKTDLGRKVGALHEAQVTGSLRRRRFVLADPWVGFGKHVTWEGNWRWCGIPGG